MTEIPSLEALASALIAAGSAHHESERRFLDGERDEQWPGWYAAYVLGRLGDFTSPSDLSTWLEAAPLADDWAPGAAEYVLDRLRAGGDA